MSKRSRDDMEVDETLGPRSAKRRALAVMDTERKEKEDASKKAAEKRQLNKKLRKDVDDLADLFGSMKASTGDASQHDMEMEGQGRRRRRRHTRKHKKSKKSKKTRKH